MLSTAENSGSIGSTVIPFSRNGWYFSRSPVNNSNQRPVRLERIPQYVIRDVCLVISCSHFPVRLRAGFSEIRGGRNLLGTAQSPRQTFEMRVCKFVLYVARAEVRSRLTRSRRRRRLQIRRHQGKRLRLRLRGKHTVSHRARYSVTCGQRLTSRSISSENVPPRTRRLWGAMEAFLSIAKSSPATASQPPDAVPSSQSPRMHRHSDRTIRNS